MSLEKCGSLYLVVNTWETNRSDWFSRVVSGDLSVIGQLRGEDKVALRFIFP